MASVWACYKKTRVGIHGVGIMSKKSSLLFVTGNLYVFCTVTKWNHFSLDTASDSGHDPHKKNKKTKRSEEEKKKRKKEKKKKKEKEKEEKGKFFLKVKFVIYLANLLNK